MFKVLLVEDNLSYRSVLKSALRKRFIDMEILEASSDHETLIAVNTFVPDMIIMDIDLKCEFTGLDLTKIIKAEHPDMVVVILSQHDIPEYRSVAQQNGADFFISKSASLDNIFDYVDTVIERKDRFEPHKQA
jgi:DNA-binding NarL/FixJ family response regulator